MGKDITDFLGNTIKSGFGGGGTGGGTGGGNQMQFFVPPTPSQSIAWSNPDAYQNIASDFRNPIANYYPNMIQNMMNYQTNNQPYQNMLNAAGNYNPNNQYQNALTATGNFFNQPSTRPNQFAPDTSTLQGYASRSLGGDYATAPTAQSNTFLNQAQNLGLQSTGGLNTLANQVTGAAAPGQTMNQANTYLSGLFDPKYTNPLENPFVSKQLGDYAAIQENQRKQDINSAAAEANKYGALSSSGLQNQIGDISLQSLNDLQRNQNQLYGSIMSNLQGLQQAGVPLAMQAQTLPQSQLMNAFNTQMQIPELGMRQGQFAQNLSMLPQEFQNQIGNRAGQMFNIGQQEWQNANQGLQNQWNQYNQDRGMALNAVNPWMALNEIPTQRARDAYNAFLQQQNQAANIANQFGQYGGQNWIRPEGYVYNQPVDSKWYDPIVNQFGNNAANALLGGLGDAVGGSGGNWLNSILGIGGAAAGAGGTGIAGALGGMLPAGWGGIGGMAGGTQAATQAAMQGPTSGAGGAFSGGSAFAQWLPAVAAAYAVLDPNIAQAGLGGISNALFGGGPEEGSPEWQAQQNVYGQQYADQFGGTYDPNAFMQSFDMSGRA